MQNTKKIAIIIPAFNEQGNIGRTVRGIFDLKLNLSVVVINDGSIDETAKEARDAGAHVISLPLNLGIGGAVQTGLQWAHERNFDMAIQVDGDGQHDVAFLSALIETSVKENADLVIGSRFLPPYSEFQSSVMRRVGIQFFSGLIGVLTGCRVTDPTSGFRVYGKKLLCVFARRYPQDFPEPEAIVIAKRFDAKIVEIPVQMHERKAGASSIRSLKSFYYMIKVTFAILLDMLHHKEGVECDAH